MKPLLHTIVAKTVCFNSLKDAKTTIEQIYFNSTRPIILSFINAHACNLVIKDRAFYKALTESDILLRDGVGMEIMFRVSNVDPGLNFNGTDFIPFFISSSSNNKIALLGTSEEVVNNAAVNNLFANHNVISVANGFWPDSYYLDILKQRKVDIVVLGMGMPRQELIAHYLRNNLNYKCIIINGGAILDFLGHRFNRAPFWIRRMKMEWFYRFLIEPRRLFSRYMIGNISFLKKILCFIFF